MTKKALLVIDVQNDFISGSLAVAGGDEVVPIIRDLQEKCSWDLIVWSQDWHPAKHASFSSEWVGKNDINGKAIEAGKTTVVNIRGTVEVFWPDHCIQGSKGAEFHKDLSVGKNVTIVQKGKNPQVDSYSAFADNSQKDLTELYSVLDKAQITEVYVCGIATDYCVNYTCQDAVVRKDKDGKPSYNTFLILDACRGVAQDTSTQAVTKLQQAPYDVKVISSKDLLQK
eukprot:TRINITY_DN830_c0_g1_i1.p2 TRINITY_DN830_c0_g1~~TRINITY_DN830_c0_g1_i1.p2  ORF type:complete len:227 (-),score=71.89 TRINITY_DN830_c0_g1_i1:18-698(-)